MGTYFLDTSAIVKRYVPEQGRVWIRTLCDPVHGHNLYISQAAFVEVVATICRRTREGSITIVDREGLINLFRRHCSKGYGVQVVDRALFIYAGDLCKQHNLRAYDAVQLACALRLHDDALANLAPLPIFVCADNNLINIAATVGLGTENPNNYL